MKSIFLIVFAIIIFLVVSVITFVAIKKGNNNHKNNKVDGIGIIVGHATNSTSGNVRYMVKILNSEDKASYNLKGVYNVKKQMLHKGKSSDASDSYCQLDFQNYSKKTGVV